MLVVLLVCDLRSLALMSFTLDILKLTHFSSLFRNCLWMWTCAIHILQIKYGYDNILLFNDGAGEQSQSYEQFYVHIIDITSLQFLEAVW